MTITLENHCVKSFSPRGGKGFEGLQTVLTFLVGADKTYTYQTGFVEKKYGGSMSDGTTATFDFDEIGKHRYRTWVGTGDQRQCGLAGIPLTNNIQSVPGAIAHESGHELNGTSDDEDADEAGAMAVENQYHATTNGAEGERCAYK